MPVRRRTTSRAAGLIAGLGLLLAACSSEAPDAGTAAPNDATPRPGETAAAPPPSPTARDAPTPTVTPTPGPGSAAFPFEIGVPVEWDFDGAGLTINITEAVRGFAARRAVQAAGDHHEASLPDGLEYALFRVVVSYNGTDAGPVSFSSADWRAISGGMVRTFEDAPVCCLDPAFELTLSAGAAGEGWVALPVDATDPTPVIGLGGDGGVHFELSPERLAHTDVLYEDDFSSDLSGWQDIFRDETGISDYDMGGFRLQVLEEYFDYWANPGLDFTDVAIEVDATRLAGPADNDFGLVCRYTGESDFYFFIVSSDGYFGIGKYLDGEIALIGSDLMQPTDLVRPGEARNHLRAECIGETLRLYINGTLQYEVMDADHTHGDVGLIAGTFAEAGTDILFDNFAVLEP